MIYAKSWSFANAGATASAFAKAITNVSNESFAEVCIAQNGNLCGQSEYSDKGICSLPPDETCANALATGEAHAGAYPLRVRKR
jgi:hypothetical protein